MTDAVSKHPDRKMCSSVCDTRCDLDSYIFTSAGRVVEGENDED